MTRSVVDIFFDTYFFSKRQIPCKRERLKLKNDQCEAAQSIGRFYLALLRRAVGFRLI